MQLGTVVHSEQGVGLLVIVYKEYINLYNHVKLTHQIHNLPSEVFFSVEMHFHS
jgi:hypothetical protein